MSIISSVDIYILSKINELGVRYGVHPCDISAELDAAGMVRFTGLPNDPEKREKFEAMLSAIGCKDYKIDASDGEDFINVLDEAVRAAPRPRYIQG